MARKFTRTIEDFVCENCGCAVKGTGYTNHCTHCLFSQHVDIDPGDRLSPCRALMEPVAIEMRSGGVVIVHQCLKCRAVKRNKASPTDSMDAILRTSTRLAERAR